MVPPPGLNSTMIGCFQVLVSSDSSSRARMSSAPPGTLGTMMRTGLLGHPAALEAVWAHALSGVLPIAPRLPARRSHWRRERFMIDRLLALRASCGSRLLADFDDATIGVYGDPVTGFDHG